MRVVGIGVDLVDPEKVRAILALPGDHFIQRSFTSKEQRCLGGVSSGLLHIAGHFAAKEATAKAFGLGWGDDLAWTDIEVFDGEAGLPFVILHRRIAAIAASARAKVHLGISYGRSHAFANSVVTADWAPHLRNIPR